MSIRVIYEPSVYLIGRQEIAGGLKPFLSDHDALGWETDTDTAGEELAEIAGRLCYMSFARPRPGGNKAYIGHILEAGHGSVLEHAVFSLILTGVSRSFTHELVRHRAGFGFSQLSQRYVDESDVAFVAPPALADDIQSAQEVIQVLLSSGAIDRETAVATLSSMEGWGGHSVGTIAGLRWISIMEDALGEYSVLSDYLSKSIANKEPSSIDRTASRKAAREAARSVLPNATETKIFVTGNARAWRHFTAMRANPGADAEMRRVAVAVLRVLQAEAPNLFGDFTIDGDSASSPFPKV